MLRGDVVGMVVASRKHDALVGYKLLRIQIGGKGGQEIIAVDKIGAGMGDQVLIAMGSAARLAAEQDAPVDAAVVGIIDPT